MNAPALIRLLAAEGCSVGEIQAATGYSEHYIVQTVEIRRLPQHRQQKWKRKKRK